MEGRQIMKPKRNLRSQNGFATDDLVCPLCDGKSIETFQHSDAFKYGANAAAVTLRVNIPVRRCTACEFEFVDHEGEQLRHEAVCRHLGVLTPAEVREIRERHCMTRAAFAEATALGQATLGRWETGALIQNRAYDYYLRLVRMPLVMRILQRLPRTGSEPAITVGVSGEAFPSLDVTKALLQRQAAFRLAI